MAAIIALLVLLWAEANGCWIWMVLGIFWMPLRFHVDIVGFLPVLGYLVCLAVPATWEYWTKSDQDLFFIKPLCMMKIKACHATVHDQSNRDPLTTLVLGSTYYWKAFEYEYKWSYPPKTISEPTPWLHVNYYRPKVKPCQDEQTLVKGAYKNQLNRVPTKVTDTNLTYRQTHVSIQWNLNAYPYPTRQVSKSWHTLDGSFNIDWRGLVIFDLPSVLKFKNMSSISTSDTSSWWELNLM